MQKIKCFHLHFLLFAIGFVLNSNNFGQNNDSIVYRSYDKVRVDSISITGNKITDSDIILSELTFIKGDVVDSLMLDYNRERIFSLRLFNYVRIGILARSDTLKILNIYVSESWYIYPIPFVQRIDNDWGKLSYGLDVRIMNFRGRNEFISARTSFGYDPSYGFGYYVPYLFRQEQVSLSVTMDIRTRKNKSETAKLLYGDDFNQKGYYASFSLGKRMSLFNKFDIYLIYNNIETDRYVSGINASKGNIDSYFSTGASYVFDTRNLVNFPTSGNYFGTSFEQKGLFASDIDYRVLTFDLRNYTNLFGNFFLKSRLYSRQVFGEDIPYYDYGFLGLNPRVRGENSSREGTKLYFGSTQLFYQVFDDIHVKYDIPLIPERLTEARLGLALHLFYDAGSTMKSFDNELNDNFMYGFGFGVTVLVLPFNTGSLDIAFNKQGKATIILDAGVSF